VQCVFSLFSHTLSPRCPLPGVKAVGLSDIPDDGDADVDVYGSGSALATLSRVLGRHRRDDVLSSVYMLLCDSSGVVRQSALQVRVSLVPAQHHRSLSLAGDLYPGLEKHRTFVRRIHPSWGMGTERCKRSSCALVPSDSYG
jgi:hypothetical protein